MSAIQTNPRVDDRNWSKLSAGEQIRMLELEGYLVVPHLLTPEQIKDLKAQTATLQTTAADYSESQRFAHNFHRLGGALADLPGNPKTIDFLRRLFGDEIIIMSCIYVISKPGHPGVSLHTDGQPYGHEIFGYEESCPVLIRVLYYLDDLTSEVSPFRVVPRSHLSLHQDGNPYSRYERHPEEVMVTAQAGDAVFLNHKCFHGNFPNTGDRAREMLAIEYRPAWAGPVPIKPVAPWEDADLVNLPEHVKLLFGDRNLRRGNFAGGHKPAGMRSEAPGIDPSRWDRH